MPATRVTSTSPSPSSRHSRRAASSASFTASSYKNAILQRGLADALVKGCQAVQMQAGRNVAHTSLTNRCRKNSRLPQFSQRSARLRIPSDSPETMQGTTARIPVSNSAETEEQRRQVRDARDQQKERPERHERDHEKHTVDPHPILVALEILLK